ncbi:type II toxin-antitoxin system HipA family toxin [Rhizobium sp. 18055]|uniref:type II toxin-antitoxin system HipA family toxin n=1 Tax=Rhizobium sp. 18055 TaxID=2681403 RepID=UPI00135C7720|nr:type II toxin-antitoxin system HipA family toxin [Rhizobium sp. 18055]
MKRAQVKLWGSNIGAVVWDETRSLGVFEYARNFLRSGIEVAPLAMPLRSGVFDFPELAWRTFKGLPGLLSDSLPDKFGNLLINRWLAQQGRPADSMNPVERLCYTGSRGMGALEFEPSAAGLGPAGAQLDIAAMVDLASAVVSDRLKLSGVLAGEDDAEALREILRIGTSAGGARAKAVLAWNPQTGEFRSGQTMPGSGFEHWLMKFDGVAGNSDKELADPNGFGRLEYACYLLAQDAGVTMAPCRLHEEGGRAHFMTKRFDRTGRGDKLHMLSLGAMRHFDFNIPRAYSYEQAIETMRLLGFDQSALEQQVRRAFLNIVIRNQDDHVKNIAFLMDRSGRWSLSPAFDVAYAYNPEGEWTSQHQMSLNGKTTGFGKADLVAFGQFADLKKSRINSILEDVIVAAKNWQAYAEIARVPETLTQGAMRGFRLEFPSVQTV